MATVNLNINSSGIRNHILTLQSLGKSAFPVVVRQTLDSAAFDVKQDTMPKEAKRFEQRKPTFFKANSAVAKAQGMDINTMESRVGFKPKPNDKSHSVEDLEQQERGGDIHNRAFIAMPLARRGGTMKGQVNTRDRLENIRAAMVNANKGNSGAANDKERFTLSAIFAGKGGYVIGTGKNSKGARTVYRINKVLRVGKDTVIGKTKVYSLKAKRTVDPDSKYHNFMRTASLNTQRKMELSFITLAEKKIKQLTARKS